MAGPTTARPPTPGWTASGTGERDDARSLAARLRGKVDEAERREEQSETRSEELDRRNDRGERLRREEEQRQRDREDRGEDAEDQQDQDGPEPPSYAW